MNISDHFTRTKYRCQKGSKVIRAFGMLLGKQIGNEIEIENSVELAVPKGFEISDSPDGQPKIQFDTAFALHRLEQYHLMKEFAHLQCLGWYSVAGMAQKQEPGKLQISIDRPSQEDFAFMAAEGPVRKFCTQAHPLMLVMNPHSQAAKDSFKLPAFLYQHG